LNGAPLDVKAGDWFVGKAAVSVVVDHPVLGHVQIFNTHVSNITFFSRVTFPYGPKLFAKGGEDGPEYNRAHRIVGAWEFSKLARQAAELGRYVIAVGVPSLTQFTLTNVKFLLRSWAILIASLQPFRSPSLENTPVFPTRGSSRIQNPCIPRPSPPPCRLSKNTALPQTHRLTHIQPEKILIRMLASTSENGWITFSTDSRGGPLV
jgi:hypothetical protein